MKNENISRAMRGNRYSVGNKGGGKQEDGYIPQFAITCRNACLLDRSTTNKHLAFLLGVPETTFRDWCKKHSDLAAAIKEGRENADANVVASLYHRARGYSHPDVHISSYEGDITVTDITKHYPPDPTSMIFWLKNRRGDLWRNEEGVNQITPEDASRKIRDLITALDAEAPAEEPKK